MYSRNLRTDNIISSSLTRTPELGWSQGKECIRDDAWDEDFFKNYYSEATRLRQFWDSWATRAHTSHLTQPRVEPFELRLGRIFFSSLARGRQGDRKRRRQGQDEKEKERKGGTYSVIGLDIEIKVVALESLHRNLHRARDWSFFFPRGSPSCADGPKASRIVLPETSAACEPNFSLCNQSRKEAREKGFLLRWLSPPEWSAVP